MYGNANRNTAELYAAIVGFIFVIILLIVLICVFLTTLTLHEEQAPTCTEVGYREYWENTLIKKYYKDRDGSEVLDESELKLSALGHDIETHEAKQPTCTEAGWNAYDTCNRDGCNHSTYQEILALGHTYDDFNKPGEWVWQNTVKAAFTYNCAVCDEKQTVIATIDFKIKTAPMCLTKGIGYNEATVTIDGETFSDASGDIELEALGHDIVLNSAQPPTCTAVGWGAHESCSRCDYTTYHEIEALGHDKIMHESKRPDCVNVGWDAYETCSRCDYNTYQEISALGHEFKNGICTRCGDAKTYYVKYDSNRSGCGNNTVNGTMPISTFKFDKEPTLPENKFTTNGYTFIGWHTRNDSRTPLYNDGATLGKDSLTTEAGKTVTLYAIWLKTSWTKELTAATGDRDRTVKDTDTVFDEGLNPFFDATMLQTWGYKTYNVYVQFDVKEIYDGYQDVWFCNTQKAQLDSRTTEHTRDKVDKTWWSHEVTFSISIDRLGGDGAFTLQWGAHGKYDDDWTLGATKIIVTACK